MQLNYLAILLATIGQFIFGAIWYTFLFGQLWGKIHGFDKLSKATQQAMMQQMGPIYGFQFLVTLLTTIVLAICLTILPGGWSAYALSGLFWLGFVLPTIVSAVLFGGTEPQWILKKIAVQAGAAFFYLQIAALVLTLLS